ncbi:MAG: dimethyl sulfoxide reductase anchor subunit [Anaerolineales bacterium]|nr:dimethyl sulfoxide reductase anchor subunit [Anaerolineales bacterium]
MAAGATWIAAALRPWLQIRFNSDSSLLVEDLLLCIVLITAVGVIASLFHLGTPVEAWRSLANLRTSWLSREILFTMLFGAAGVICAGLYQFNIVNAALRSLAVWGAAILGVLMVYSMGRVYLLHTVDAWNSPATLLSFFAAALLLGSLAAGVMITVTYLTTPDPCFSGLCALPSDILSGVGLLILFSLGLEIFAAALWNSQTDKTEEQKWLERAALIRLALLLVGAGGGGILLYRSAFIPTTDEALFWIALSAWGLCLAGEIIGRIQFYRSRERKGM